MQLMSWAVARLGSRFSLLFEPYRRRVMHSALGRFLDRPLDLKVGFVEPDGTHRVLPFTRHEQTLYNCEQFDRVNSITFRGYSEKYRLRFEFNVHSVFYPQDERLCIMPAFYLEMRVNPVPRVRWHKPQDECPERVRLFIQLDRPDTDIQAHCNESDQAGRIDLHYHNALEPRAGAMPGASSAAASPGPDGPVEVFERIVSLNRDCTVTEDGKGLYLELPVTESGSGIKWRLVWAAHCAEPVVQVADPRAAEALRPGRFRYLQCWANVNEVIEEAVAQRDERLAHSRRFEKLLEQAPLDGAQRHLCNQSFQSWLSNTFWFDAPSARDAAVTEPWFTVWEGNCFYHSTLDVEYNVALVYLLLWPQLLGMQFRQWALHEQAHDPSQGAYLSHDLGQGSRITGQAYPHAMEVEENCNYLLLLQAYAHWTGDLSIAREQVDLLERLGRYLLWTDRDQSGFPSEGVANTIDDAGPAVQYARKQTYLAVKRVAALCAVGDLLGRCGREAAAASFERAGNEDLRRIERAAWLGDHYAVCVDASAVGLSDVWSGQPLTSTQLEGWDAYSIYAANAQLLPTLVGQPPLLQNERVISDLIAAMRECLGRYGCGHTSLEPENVWVSQNLWRDHLARYLGHSGPSFAQHYWDLQVMSNTFDNSKGFIDTYIHNNLCFYPRGVVSLGYFLAHPRLIIDRLAPGGAYITVEPDRHFRQRWPLLPLADWKAGKIPVCVVNSDGKVTIEGKIDPVIIHGEAASASEMIG